MKATGALHENDTAPRGSGGQPARGARGEIIRLLDRQRGEAPAPGDGAGGTEPPAWESECAARARRGDAAAFDRLVEAYAGRIHAHLWRIVRNREDAEDLAQETFLRAYRALARFDARRPFRSWLYTIATNVGLNALRTRSRRLQPDSLDASGVDGRPLREAASPRREEQREAVEQSERRARLEAAIDQLPPRAAALVRLHYTEDMPLREAGEVVGLGESAAKVALFRARKQLRELLTGDGTS